MLSEVFWTFLITSSIGFVIGALRLCYKSKCETIEISCRGIRIVRDTLGEEKLDEVQRQNSNKEEEQKV
jgi:hypothetical protein